MQPFQLSRMHEHLLGSPLPAKESLGEGRNKTDLDEQTNDRLDCRNDGHRVAQALQRLEEASAMKAADTEDQGFIPLERLNR